MRNLAEPVRISFLTNGPVPEPGRVFYAGPAPNTIGLAQMYIQLPAYRPYSFPSISLDVSIGSTSLPVPSIWIH